jgi:molecular chaperone DnaK (HSP70)
MRLGIDFGTTRTVVAAVQDGRHPLAVFDDDGEFRDHVPGIAAWQDGALVVGWPAARALADGSAEHAIRSIKRAIGALAPDAPVPGLPGVTALGLATAFFVELRAALRERCTLDVDPDAPLEVMAAVPANAPSRQRWLTLEALRRAGFAPLGLLNEPTAGALDFAHRHLELGRKSPKKYVVVYDLGGGTFDTSAVSLQGRQFDLIASAGLARLGGDDFDQLVLDVAGVEATAATLERARLAKESLTPTSRKLLLDLGDREPIALDAAALYARAQPLIDATLAQVDGLFAGLRDRGIDPDDPRELGGIYLVGGGRRVPRGGPRAAGALRPQAAAGAAAVRRHRDRPRAGRRSRRPRADPRGRHPPLRRVARGRRRRRQGLRLAARQGHRRADRRRAALPPGPPGRPPALPRVRRARRRRPAGPGPGALRRHLLPVRPRAGRSRRARRRAEPRAASS